MRAICKAFIRPFTAMRAHRIIIIAAETASHFFEPRKVDHIRFFEFSRVLPCRFVYRAAAAQPDKIQPVPPESRNKEYVQICIAFIQHRFCHTAAVRACYAAEIPDLLFFPIYTKNADKEQSITFTIVCCAIIISHFLTNRSTGACVVGDPEIK